MMVGVARTDRRTDPATPSRGAEVGDPTPAGSARPSVHGSRTVPALARRSVLTIGGTAALLTTAGCNPFSSTRVTRTEVVTAPPPIDPIDQLIAKTRLHYLRLVASVKLGSTATKLTPLRDDRRRHLQALLDEQARTTRQKADPLTQPGQTVPPPASAAEAVTLAATDAQDAQTAFTDALGSVSRYRATLFATIAASLAGHQEALS